MPRLLLSLLAIGLLAALTVWGSETLYDRRPQAQRLPPRELGPVPVVTRSLAAGPVRVEVEGFGTLSAPRRVDLAPELGGRVAARLEPWTLGRFVEAGTVLVELDGGLIEKELRAGEAALQEARDALATAREERRAATVAEPLAEEALELARREEARLARLSDSAVASASQRDSAARARTQAATALEEARSRVRLAEAGRAQAESAVASAEAALELVRERLARTVIRAPFDGHLTAEGPRVGDYLALGMPFGRLVDLSALRVVVQVSEEEFADLELGQAVRVEPTARPELSLAAVVVGLGTEAAPTLRSLPVEVELPQRGGTASRDGDAWGGLRPGQFVRVAVTTANVAGGLVLGRDELAWRDGRPTAFVVSGEGDGARVEARTLALGPRVDGGYLVERGLAVGDQLILAPIGRLRGGEACRVRTD